MTKEYAEIILMSNILMERFYCSGSDGKVTRGVLPLPLSIASADTNADRETSKGNLPNRILDR